MIPKQKVELKWSGHCRKHYENRGYVYTGYLDVFYVDVEDLTSGANTNIRIICDYCGKEFSVKYSYYMQNKERTPIKKDCCKNCVHLKSKDVCLLKNGVEHPSQLESFQDKIKKTNLEKYGVENVSQSSEIKEKKKQICLKNWGVEYNFQSGEIKEKINKTNLERYGSIIPTKNKEIKEAIKQTNLEKYGVVCPLNAPEVKEKIKATCLERYGTENPLGSQEIKEKIKNTNLERYGCVNPLQNKEIQEKAKQTNLERRGVEYPTQSTEVKETMKRNNLKKYGFEHTLQIPSVRSRIEKTNLFKYGVENPLQNREIQLRARASYYLNGNCPCSKPQKKLYDILKDCGYKVELNYPSSLYNYDIALFHESGIKIDVEYDGYYWHKNTQEKDKRRDEFSIKNGWKVLRIKSQRKLPTKDEVVSLVEELANTNKEYLELDMKDYQPKIKQEE